MMDGSEKIESQDRRTAQELLGFFILVVAGVAFFRRKKKLSVTGTESSEEWEDCLGI
jgi:hypothetical protein